MIWSSLPHKWPIQVPFCGMDHQKSNFSLISGTLSVGGHWGQLMLVFLKNSCGTQKFPISAFQNHLQTKSNLHIYICQSQFIKSISKWDTLYVLETHNYCNYLSQWWVEFDFELNWLWLFTTQFFDKVLLDTWMGIKEILRKIWLIAANI